MNLHQLVRGAISAVNPDTLAVIQTSTGYTTAANGQQQPTYATTYNVTVQVQGLTAPELDHVDSLNIQGTLRGFWINGNVQGTVRSLGKGGDILTMANGSTWLVVHVLETWDSAGWCHVVGQLQ